MRFTGRPTLATTVMAREFLEGLTTPGRQGHDRLRDVGDQCLLYSGLFPRSAERRLVRVSYYVDLGRAAYSHLAEDRVPGSAELYSRLAHSFVALMEVLQAMSNLTGAPTLDLLQAIELWHDTGSSQSLRHWRRQPMYQAAVVITEKTLRASDKMNTGHRGAEGAEL